ncbi:MAG: class I SAM-dependent DNA methyltransferase [Cyanobacteriota bacterium]|nr:class I SAM-dependent DNA methyltransferase [Cyanobacteriota bacterium]
MNREDLKTLENRLWDAADKLRANTDLKSSEYATPVLGLIFLKFVDSKYSQVEPEIKAEYEQRRGGRLERDIRDIAIEKCGFYLPDHARYDYLANLPEEEDIVNRVKDAMKAIEAHRPELDGVLPKDEYNRFNPSLANRSEVNNAQQKGALFDLLKNFDNIPVDHSGDWFGKIYEFFLGKFALSEGQKAGEFFTPTSVVRLMVEIIEPYRGAVYDPACGSGGMFVQSQKFIERRRQRLEAVGESLQEGDIYVYGQEKTLETVKLAQMNLFVNGLRGEVRQGNTYSEDPFESLGKFDYVLANPPFNVDDVPLALVESDPRFNAYGIPRKKSPTQKKDEGKDTVTNANYLWINLFAASLNERGRAALVMANSASDARHTEAEIRQKLIESNLIYGMLTLPSNLFYTVTLPATLWFFDRAKTDERILFIDARNIFTQVDRAHREFSEEQIQNIAMISKLHRGEREEFIRLIDAYFERGMEGLGNHQAAIKAVSAQLLKVLALEAGQRAVEGLMGPWRVFESLTASYQAYRGQVNLALKAADNIVRVNERQRALRLEFDLFFQSLHGGLKDLERAVRRHEKALLRGEEGKRVTVDKDTKQLKEQLNELQREVKASEEFFLQIHWLQERFPQACYEDVTGLCKLATLAEVKEQDYSLNPGRYVGVVIEEDGKTEEEFLADLLQMNQQLGELNETALALGAVVAKNVAQLVGDEETAI